MASLTEHTMLNGLEENLKNAIEYAGGYIPANTSIWKYPEIIRQQMGVGKKFDVIGKDGINVTIDDNGNFVISLDNNNIQTTENITIDAIDAPSFSGIETWPEGYPLQDLLEDLFYKVIPNIPSVTKGDIIITDENGNDPFGGPQDYINSMKPNTMYMRIFVSSQIDPIYISLEQITTGGTDINLSNYYTKDQVNAKIDMLSDRIDSIEIPETNLDDYYTKEEVDSKIDSIEIPETNLDDYYTKDDMDKKLSQYYTAYETNSLVNAKINDNLATEEDAILNFENIFIK